MSYRSRCGPKTLAEHVGPTLRGVAEEAGRPESAVRVAAWLPVSVTDDVDAARARAAEEFAIYGQLPSYRAMLDRERYAGPEDAAIIGDENTVSDRLDQLAKAGVDEFPAVTFDPAPTGVNAPARCCEQQTNKSQISSGVTAVTSVRSIARRVRE